MNYLTSRKGAILILGLSIIAPALYGGSIIGSRHDLSTGSSPEVCVFCHTPHNANPDVASPLWNRAGTEQVFTLYSSNTLDNIPGQPSPVSELCLGCHDGVMSTIMVLGVPRDNKHHLINYNGFPDETSYPNCERCHSDIYSGKPRTLVLGTDLSNDHPISMDYPVSGGGGEFFIPPSAQTGWGQGNTRLVSGKVECVSCHEVHDPDITPFLIKSTDICITCHNK